MKDGDERPLAIVVPFQPGYGNAETVLLPGDTPYVPRFQTCQACQADMPITALFSLDEDDVEFFLCADHESCNARVEALKKTSGTSSFLFDAVNRLTTRVEELEKWRASLGSGSAVPAVVGSASPLGATTADGVDSDITTWVMGNLGNIGHTLARADARALPMDDACVDLVVTSPPYWAQRSYTDGGEHYAGQIGDEATPGEYIDNLIACTREWMRVLKPGGSIWVNLGDKYAGGGGQWEGDTRPDALRVGRSVSSAQRRSGAPAKSLIGLPWRYALRCVDELGLILRAEVVWAKPNGLPESVTDRVRRSHEQWFHFTKNPTYFASIDAIREPYATTALADQRGRSMRGYPGSGRNEGMAGTVKGRLPGSVREVTTQPLTVPDEIGVDHFAAFPMEWPRWIIQGWSPQSVCATCQEGRRATVGGEWCACTPYTTHLGTGESSGPRYSEAVANGAYPPFSLDERPKVGTYREYHFDDWTPPPTSPGVVLDPFGGTGTTALVAEMFGRHGVHFDLSASYLKIAEWRVNDPGQRASALLVPRPPVQLPGQMDFMDLLRGNE